MNDIILIELFSGIGGFHKGLSDAGFNITHCYFSEIDKVPNIVVQVKSATKKGYEEAKEGDSINMSVPNSKTRRGRVGVGVGQTLDTQCNQAVIVASRGRNQSNTSDRTTGAPTEQRLEANNSGQTICLTAVEKDNYVLEHSQIRRLTEVECERLQGYNDNWTKFGNYDGVVKEIRRTQRYKLCGNAVTASIVELIAKKLLNPASQ